MIKGKLYKFTSFETLNLVVLLRGLCKSIGRFIDSVEKEKEEDFFCLNVELIRKLTKYVLESKKPKMFLFGYR